MKKITKIIILLIIVVAIVILIKPIKNQVIKKIYKKDYSEYVSKYSQQYNVEENLIYAIIKAESNFKANAISHQNAKGLMQLMEPTAKDVAKRFGIELTDDNILEPETNINIGTKYISTLLDKYGSVEVALAAYNAGSGNVDKWIQNGTIKCKSKLGEGSEITFSLPIVKCEEERKVLDSNFNLCINEYFEG